MKHGTPGFNGERLSLALKMRRIAVSDLAKMIDVSRQMISQYLSCETTPSPETLGRIANSLNFPKPFFLKEMVVNESNPIFYRSMSSATKGQRLSAQSKHQILKEIYTFLYRYIERVNVSLPDLGIIKPYLLTADEIDGIADQVRLEWSLKFGPISNIIQLLENKGILISAFEMEAEGLNAFSEWDTQTASPFIILNFDHSESKSVRLRYNAAHELGHLLLHRYVNIEDLRNTQKFKLIETQAHRFASAFLLPEKGFIPEVRALNLDAFIDLKSRWKVSIQAMIMRCHQLGLLTDQGKENLFISLSKRGWRKIEPLDDEFEKELPQFLAKAFNLLLLEMFSVDDILHQLSLSPRDIQEIACLPENILLRNEVVQNVVVPKLSRIK